MHDLWTIQWTSSAEQDLLSILGDIEFKHPLTARTCLERIKLKTNTLQTMPQRGRLAPELKRHGISIYRELMVNSWRLIYRIEKKSVIVLAFLDSRRGLEDVLLDRLIR